MPPSAHFDEERVKALTGGDAIRAEEKFQKSFVFSPQFKLVLIGMMCPISQMQEKVSAAGFAYCHSRIRFRRRSVIHSSLIAYSEGAAILGWAVNGYLKWQENGLTFPTAMKRASDSYLIEQNPIGRFMADCLSPDPTTAIPNDDLYKAYSRWCSNNSEFQLSLAALKNV
jgi:putative DNA primase/helicase